MNVEQRKTGGQPGGETVIQRQSRTETGLARAAGNVGLFERVTVGPNDGTVVAKDVRERTFEIRTSLKPITL